MVGYHFVDFILCRPDQFPDFWQPKAVKKPHFDSCLVDFARFDKVESQKSSPLPEVLLIFTKAGIGPTLGLPEISDQ